MVEYQQKLHVVLQVVGRVVVRVVVRGLVEVQTVVLVVFLQNKFVEFQGEWHLVVYQQVTNTFISFKFKQHDFKNKVLKYLVSFYFLFIILVM